MIVENHGGAAHIIGAQAVAKAAPDGYTLLIAEAGTFTVNPSIDPKASCPTTPDKDFIPISGLVRINQALLADRALPVANAADLIALAKAEAGPTDLRHRRHRLGLAHEHGTVRDHGGREAHPRALSRCDARAQRSDRRQHQCDVGERRPPAVPPSKPVRSSSSASAAPNGLPQAPDVPTVDESGLPGYQAVTWFGLFGPPARRATSS